MSKKKFSAGSMTMTLKDFHGGSIPSEHTLPSAPGVSARPHDRPSAWTAATNAIGSSTGARADLHRPRPGSSGGLPRVLDERGPAFLSSPSFIGHHFDEDERKPFDSSSAPRRPSIVTAETTRSQPVVVSQASARSDPKRPVSSPVVAQHLSPSPGVSTSSAGNAWAARKEAPVKGGMVTEPPQTHPSVTSGPAAASRFAHASAIEKVSSGRWQSKPPDVEVVRFQDVESLDRRTVDSVPIWNDEEGNLGRLSSSSGVKDRKLGGLHSDGFLQQERVISESREISVFGYQSDLARPVSHEGRVTASHYQHTLDEALERPKLKLLPRTKPLEPSDTTISEDKQGYLYPTSLMHMEEPQEMCRTVGKMKPGLVGADAVSRPAERPKLNLKPRSEHIELRDESYEKERKTLFGGARPREFVLKERAVDGTDNREIVAQTNRVKPDVLKLDSKPEPTAFSLNRHIEAVESSPAERRSLRDAAQKDNQPYNDKGDAQRNSRRNENWRNPRETEKKPLERLQEPETWRKPVEPPKPETPPGPRVIRAASALELAQAFSRSMSDSRVDNRYTNQTILPGRTQIPFSRLTDTREMYSGSTHRHINGY